MSSMLSMILTFDPDVTFNGSTVSLPPVTSTKIFGSNNDVQRFLTAYQGFLNMALTASAETVVGAWWDSVTNDIILNTGCEAPPIVLADGN